MVGIYKIVSPNGKVYIGQSWDLNKRINFYYKRKICSCQRKLCNSLKKYGWENHIFIICHELPFDVSQDILNLYELIYYEQYRDSGMEMMNLQEPGKGYGKHSEETKQLMSIKQKESHKNPNRKRNYICVAVIQISTDGTEKEWKSRKIAAEFFGVSPRSIGYAIKYKSNCRGYKWRHKVKNPPL